MFNQNKNFTGGLKGISKENEKEQEKESSGLGFEDEYDYFWLESIILYRF